MNSQLHTLWPAFKMNSDQHFCDGTEDRVTPLNVTFQDKTKQLGGLCSNVLNSIFHYVTEENALCLRDITLFLLDPFNTHKSVMDSCHVDQFLT
jgi:hypothetical protein